MITNTLSLPKLIKIENSDTITEKSVFELFKQSELLNEMRYNTPFKKYFNLNR